MNVEMLCIMIMLICTCRYLAVPESDHLTGLDPLNWWSVNATNYPIISVLAKKYLAIPASSASSERVFSTAKNITDKKRWRLLPERLHKTIFFTPQSILLEIALFFQTLYFVVCFIMCVCHCCICIAFLGFILSALWTAVRPSVRPTVTVLDCLICARSRSGHGLPT